MKDIQGQQLAQSRPTNTTATSVYSPPGAGISTRVFNVVVCNTTGSSAAFRIFHDDNGTTYDETTALFWDVSLDANSSVQLDCDWWLFNPDGNLAIRTDTGSALTFTFYGAEHQI